MFPCFKALGFKKVIEFLTRARPQDLFKWNSQFTSDTLKTVTFRERIKITQSLYHSTGVRVSECRRKREVKATL